MWAVAGFQRASWSAMKSWTCSQLRSPARIGWPCVGLAVESEEPDGVGVGLDGRWALGLGFQGAAQAVVEGQAVPRGNGPPRGAGCRSGMVPDLRVVERLAPGGVLRTGDPLLPKQVR